MDKKLNRKINFLTGYAVLSTLLFVFILLTSFSNKDKQSVDEITLKRLNLIGEDGSLRMVISNEARQHPGRIEGKDLPKRERPAGIIFFNNQGDECGGIVSSVSEENGSINSGMSFTMDNYHNDQVMQIINDETYENGNATITRGLIFNEFPIGLSMNATMKKYEELQKIKDPHEKKEKIQALISKEGSKRRLFIGRNKSNDSGLFLYDSIGNPKMKIYVDKNGTPKIEIMDKEGKAKNVLTVSN